MDRNISKNCVLFDDYYCYYYDAYSHELLCLPKRLTVYHPYHYFMDSLTSPLVIGSC